MASVQINRSDPTSTERYCVLSADTATEEEDADSEPNDVRQTEPEANPGGSTSEMLIKCNNCDAHFEEKSDLESHTKEFHPNIEEPRKCYKCYITFPSVKEYYSHNCVKILAFICGNCGRSFETKSHLMKHMERHGVKKPTEFLCDKEGLERITKSGFTSHERRHREKSFACRECGSKCADKDDLAKHVCDQPSIKKFICEVCGKTWKNESQLVRHQSIHSEDRNFECDLCDKKFKCKANLSAHKVYHSGEKKHICEHCSKGFFTSYQLKVHQRLHTGETPYKCSICGKAFPWEMSYKMHMKRHATI